MMHLILGGSGFIGMRLIRTLLAADNEIIVVDKAIETELLALNEHEPKLRIFKFDIINSEGLKKLLIQELDTQPIILWHLAANSNILNGVNNSMIDFKDTLGTTCTAVEISRMFNTRLFIFSSSSAVYGDMKDKLLREDDMEFFPISNYGVMKLSSEYLLKANNSLFNVPTLIFRFPNVVGWPTTHGVIFDLYNKLTKSNLILEVLGDGFQTKPYIHVDDLIQIMIKISNLNPNFEVINIAPDDSGISVREIVEILTHHLSLNPKIIYQKSSYGWLGDVPRYHFDVTKLNKFITNLNLRSKNAIEKTMKEIPW